MPTRDPRVDAYIAKSADFARPILQHIRAAIHEGCPDVVETIKWSRPAFDYRGAPLCGIAAFKEHCSLGFWHSPDLTLSGKPIGGPGEKGGMGNFGRIASVQDLPSRSALVKLVRQAAKLSEEGGRTVMTRASPEKKSPPRPVVVPEDLSRALARNRKARDTFENFPPSHQREYVEWITGAKRDETRSKRVATALEWLVEGKPRNWKYMR